MPPPLHNYVYAYRNLQRPLTWGEKKKKKQKEEEGGGHDRSHYFVLW